MGRGVENLRGKTTKVRGAAFTFYSENFEGSTSKGGHLFLAVCGWGGALSFDIFFIAYNIKPILFWQVGLRGRFFGTRSQAKFVHHPPYPPQIMDSP